ncbi:MAG: hypothetical protein WC768_02795, partial [Patescibacteria group bacterium]
MKKITKTKITLLAILALAVVTTGFRCTWVSPAEQQLLEPVELTWWGVFDDPENFSEIISDYSALHPNIKITYR